MFFTSHDRSVLQTTTCPLPSQAVGLRGAREEAAKQGTLLSSVTEFGALVEQGLHLRPASCGLASQQISP